MHAMQPWKTSLGAPRADKDASNSFLNSEEYAIDEAMLSERAGKYITSEAYSSS
jgi:hypothetical protein